MNVQTILRSGWLTGTALARLLRPGKSSAADAHSGSTNFWSDFSRDGEAVWPTENREGERGNLNILVPFDFTNSSTAAFECAMRMARNRRAKITLLHAVNINLTPYGPANPALIQRDLRRTARGRLNAVAAPARQWNIAVDSAIQDGQPGAVIEQYLRENEVDLVIIGRHRHGRLGWFVGRNVAEKVVRRARCPVLVLQEEGKTCI